MELLRKVLDWVWLLAGVGAVLAWLNYVWEARKLDDPSDRAELRGISSREFVGCLVVSVLAFMASGWASDQVKSAKAPTEDWRKVALASQPGEKLPGPAPKHGCGIPFIRRVALDVCTFSVVNGNNIDAAISTASAGNPSDCASDKETGLQVGSDMAQDVMLNNITCDAALILRNPDIGSRSGG